MKEKISRIRFVKLPELDGKFKEIDGELINEFFGNKKKNGTSSSRSKKK